MASGPPAPDTVSLSDEELARRVQKGSSASFGILLERYQGRVYNFLLRRAGSPAEAEDLTQEAFVRAWERIATYDSARGFSTWLFTIAARLASGRRRWRAREAARRTRAFLPPPPVDPWDGIGRADLATRAWELVDRLLPDEQRSAVWLRYVEDMPIQEIARVLGKSNVAVRVSLFRARQTLARELGLHDHGRGAGGK